MIEEERDRDGVRERRALLHIYLIIRSRLGGCPMARGCEHEESTKKREKRVGREKVRRGKSQA